MTNPHNNTILDLIKEKIINIDRSTTKSDIKQAISEALTIMAKREENLRKSTITLSQGQAINQEQIKQYILDDWGQKFNPVIWQDKDNVFVKLIDEEAKIKLMELMKSTHGKTRELAQLIKKPDELNNHFSRKPVRLEIPNAKPNLKIQDILAQLESIGYGETKFEQPKEGKLSQTNTRTLSFLTNAKGFELIFDKLEGCINLTQTGLKVWPKTAAKPWTCRDCFQIGSNHKCSGKLCANCGSGEHNNKDCKATTRTCSNCRAKGHRAKDLQCPKLLTSITRELQRCDIPIQFLQEKHLKTILIASLQLK